MSTLAVTNLKHESATGNNIVLDSSGNVAFADGSASAPSITNDGDTNTGIYFPAADNIGFATNGVIRGRWTTDGLCFGSDTAAANALDDYEEGTFTPTVIGSSTAGTGTYTAQSGRYTKIGRSVTVEIYVSWSAHTGTGNLWVASLPFTNATGGNAGVAFTYINNVALTANNVMVGSSRQNETNINFYQYPVGGGAATNVSLDTSADLGFSMTYFTA